MMREQSFRDIRAGLEAGGFPATFAPVNDETPLDQLYCLVYVDDQDRAYMTRMTFANDIAATMGAKTSINDIVQFQMNMSLPFPVKEKAAADIAQILHMINMVNALGAFIQIEDTQEIVFRLVLTSSSFSIKPAQVVEAVNMTLSALILYSGLIEDVASGTLRYTDALAEIQAQRQEKNAPQLAKENR